MDGFMVIYRKTDVIVSNWRCSHGNVKVILRPSKSKDFVNTQPVFTKLLDFEGAVSIV